MKRNPALILAILIMSLTACGGASKGQEQSQPAETAVQIEAEPTEAEDQTEAPPAETEDQAEAQQEEADAEHAESIPYWTEGSAVADSIISYVEAVTEETSESYVAPEERIAIFDFDGTLYGERYPTYFDTCLFIHRALHDENFTAPEEIREYASAMEAALYNYLPEPDSDKSTAQCAAECFKGMTVEEYREYVRNYMSTPIFGFEGMTYGEGFYKPMTALVQYLSENGFTVFISSGSERAMVRELIKGTLDEWISSETKNQNTNKVFSIIDEIGQCPVLVFGNSSGDLAMAQYVLQHGGKGYMLLCDDLERDYGSLEAADKFADSCEKMGLETVSMKNDFATIYGDNAVKVEESLETQETPAQTQEAPADSEEQTEEQELEPAA